MNYERRNKHMTLDDRIEIQECLNKGMTFKAIAQRIEKIKLRCQKRQTYTRKSIQTDLPKPMNVALNF